jgi:hypothetical protein
MEDAGQLGLPFEQRLKASRKQGRGQGRQPGAGGELLVAPWRLVLEARDLDGLKPAAVNVPVPEVHGLGQQLGGGGQGFARG